jgi:FkbH-like protein
MAMKGQGGGAPLHLVVHRNTPAEFLLGPLAVFAAYSQWSLQTVVGAYDDALLFQDVPSGDVDLIWLDFERYLQRTGPGEVAAWVAERVAELRSRSHAPILVAGAEPPLSEGFDLQLKEGLRSLADVRVVPRLPLATELGEAYFDGRFRTEGGTDKSDAAFVGMARELGLVWIPAALRPRLKVVAVDLDHTLYDGVLGEDGPSGLRLTSAHADVQRRLVALQEEGFLLAVVSRNESVDAEALFEARTDFPLRREHVSCFEIGWGSKAAALTRVADQCRVGLDAILFLDDNPGELASVASAHPEVRLLHAGNPEQTLRALRWYPGLARWSEGGADSLRSRDLMASEVRSAQVGQSPDPLAYLRTLQVHLRFVRRSGKDIPRLVELSGKTNQFNLALRRFSEAEIRGRASDPHATWVSGALSDRLSDSGIVLALVAIFEADRLIVEDLCISCRALGRGIEDRIIGEALNGLLAGTPIRRILFRHATGPRNGPARAWLSHLAGSSLAEEGTVEMERSSLAPQGQEAFPVTIEWGSE